MRLPSPPNAKPNAGYRKNIELDFVPFWEWRKQIADSELHHEQEKLKEEPLRLES